MLLVFGYGFGLVCLLVFPKVFRKPKKTFGKTINIKKKETKNKFGKTNNKNSLFKGFRPTIGYGFVLFGCLVFPKVFRKPNKYSGKPKIPKKTIESNKNLRENKKKQSC